MKIGKKFTKGDILKGGGGSGGGSTARSGRSLWGMVKRAFGRRVKSKVPKILEAKKHTDWGGSKKKFKKSPAQVRKKHYMSEPEIKKRQTARVKELETKKAEKLSKWETTEGAKKYRSDFKKLREKEKAVESEKKRVKDIETDVEKAKFEGSESRLLGIKPSDIKKGATKAALISALLFAAKSMGPKEKEKIAKKILKKREGKKDSYKKRIKYTIGGKPIYFKQKKDPYKKLKSNYEEIYKMGKNKK